MKKQHRQWLVMRDAVANAAQRTIDEYRKGRYHGCEVATILGELFEAANDTIDCPRLAQHSQPEEGEGTKDGRKRP